MSRHIRATLLASALAVVACESRSRAPEAPPAAVSDSLVVRVAPELLALDSIVLQEPDSLTLGVPLAFTVRDDGVMLVGDGATGRVLRYAPSGVLVGAYGRQGQGPGEYLAPAALAWLPDGGMAVADWGQDAVIFTDSVGVETSRMPLAGVGSTIATDGDTVLVGRLTREAPYTSVIVIPPVPDTTSTMLLAPDPYGALSLLRAAHPYVTVARVNDRIVVGYSGVNQLRDTLPGQVAGTFTIPRRLRRELPRHLADLFAVPLPDSVVAGMASLLVALLPLEGDQVAAIHLDVVLSGRSMSTAAWLSVLDFSTGLACVDAAVPLHGDGKPLFATRGNALLVLMQRSDAADSATTMVQRFGVDTSACQWIGLGGR